MSRCEDAPACGHFECGFGPGVPGYGSNVGGVPYFGEHKPPDATPLPVDYDKARHLIGELRAELRPLTVNPDRPAPNGATMFSRVLDSMTAFVDEHEATRKSDTITEGQDNG